ncbi:MAG: hypothetical protein ACAH80_04485 [Alphaproteobacteria bacterium]
MVTFIPIKRADSAVLDILKDARLAGVTYRYLPWGEEKGYTSGHEGVDDDIAAVVLDLADRGKVVVTWAMTGALEGLTLLAEEAYSGTIDEVLEAAEREAWRNHIGHSITSVAASWQISGEDCPESLWSIRIGFPEGSVVIALGQVRASIEYMPDELVVIFDSSLARSYLPLGVYESAWGVPISPPEGSE